MTKEHHDNTVRTVWVRWFREAVLLGRTMAHCEFSRYLKGDSNAKSKVLAELALDGLVKQHGPGNRAGQFEYPPADVRKIPVQVQPRDVVEAAVQASRGLHWKQKQLEERVRELEAKLRAGEERLRTRDQDVAALTEQLDSVRKSVSNLAVAVGLELGVSSNPDVAVPSLLWPGDSQRAPVPSVQ